MRANNIGNEINFDDLVYVPQRLVSEDQRLKVNDIVIAMSSGSKSVVGKAAQLRSRFDGTFGAFCAVARPDPVVDAQFLGWFLQTKEYRQRVSDDSKGSNINNLKRDDILGVPFRLPPLAEQERIVEKIETLFAEIDKGEEALRAVRKLLARYRQSVLKAAVTGALTGQDGSKWPLTRLGDLLEDIRYGTAKKCHPDAAGTAVLRIPNVVGGNIDLTDLKFTDLTDGELSKLALRVGDLLLVRSNGSASLVGRGSVVTSDAEGLAYAGYLIRLRVDRSRLLPSFLHLALSSPVIRASIERQAKSTSGVHNLNSAEVKAISFQLPPLDEQEAIVRMVDEMEVRTFQAETWCRDELRRSAALRQSILKDAFAGKLVPQDPADEPAADLLARIRASQAAAPTRTRRKAMA